MFQTLLTCERDDSWGSTTIGQEKSDCETGYFGGGGALKPSEIVPGQQNRK